MCDALKRGGGRAGGADFSKLKAQVEEADQRIGTSAAQGVDQLKEMVDEARTDADARAAELSTKAQEAGDKAEAHWNQVQSDRDRHVKQIRKRIDAKKAELDADVAERDAEWAEVDVYEAVQFAQAAIEEARVRRAGRCAGEERRGRTRCGEVAHSSADCETLSAPQGALSIGGARK